MSHTVNLCHHYLTELYTHVLFIGRLFIVSPKMITINNLFFLINYVFNNVDNAEKVTEK